VDTFIVSGTRDASDILAVLYFASLVGLFSTRKETSHLRVVPLFETEQDLARAPDVMRRLYGNSLYRQQLERWGGEQEIMLDYSDRDKEAGYVTSQWSLYQAQQSMFAEWPFFHWLIASAQLALGQVDLEVGRAYSSLVPHLEVRERYCNLLESEFHRAVDAVNCIVGQQRLLDSWPVLQRSIELRNPYIAPMSYIQIRSIRELRQEPEGAQAELLRSIVDRSVTGVAAGLQATG
jgi:phosphoenolpyruvate carboxylase